MRRILSKKLGVLVALCVILLTLFMFSGCTTGDSHNRMELIEVGWNYRILKDKETGVLYIGLKAYTPMVDAEGKVLYEN